MIDLKIRNCKLKASPWLHSDLMYMAYFYTHNLYEAFVEEGEKKWKNKN